MRSFGSFLCSIWCNICNRDLLFWKFCHQSPHCRRLDDWATVVGGRKDLRRLFGLVFEVYMPLYTYVRESDMFLCNESFCVLYVATAIATARREKHSTCLLWVRYWKISMWHERVTDIDENKSIDTSLANSCALCSTVRSVLVIPAVRAWAVWSLVNGAVRKTFTGGYFWHWICPYMLLYSNLVWCIGVRDDSHSFFEPDSFARRQVKVYGWNDINKAYSSFLSNSFYSTFMW